MKVEKDDDDDDAAAADASSIVEPEELPGLLPRNRTGEAVKQLFCGGL